MNRLTDKFVKETLDTLEPTKPTKSADGEDVLSVRLPSTYEIHSSITIPKECAFVEFNGERFIRVSALTAEELSEVLGRI